MKKILIGLLVVVVLVVVAAVAVPFLVPTETYKGEITRRVEAATGRQMAIAGDLNFTVLPNLGFRAEDVRLANVEGAAEPEMARLKALHVELKPWPLLRGSVEVDRFVLVEPVMHLEIDAGGRPNWQFGTAAAERPDEAGAAEPGRDPGTGREGGVTLPVTELRLGDIRIEDGLITFSDARSGTTERIEDVDLGVELASVRSPLVASGSFRYQGEPVALDLRVENPLALIQGGASPVRFAADAEPVRASFEGEVNGGATPEVAGAVALDVVSIRDLAAWLGEPLEFEGEGLRRLAVEGRLVAAGNDLAFENAAIRLDDIEATGAVAVSTAGERPSVSGRLDVGALDLNPYLAPAEAADDEPATAAATTPAGDGAADDWSDEPIALPPVLGLADLDFELMVASLRLREIETGRGVLALAADDRSLTAELTELQLYGGRGSGAVEVTVPDGVPAFRTRLALEGVEALPLLRAAGEFERLEGTLQADVDLTTRGVSERQLVSGLNGQGRLTFRDGAIIGINLAAMVRNLRTAFLDPAAAEVRRTDFAELGGSFTVQNGIVRNDDLTLQAPLLRLAGAGTVDLPERRISYRIEPRAAPTLEGQEGRADVAGLMVPVIIEGPLMDPEIRPDLAAVIDQAARNPEELRRQIETLGESARDLREGLRDMTEGDGVGRLIEGLGERDGERPRLPQVLDRLLGR